MSRFFDALPQPTNETNSSTPPLSAPLQIVRDLDTDSLGLDRAPRFSLAAASRARLAALAGDESGGAEKFGVLAARLKYLQDRRPIRKLVVTSLLKGEGKTVISSNLALTLGRRQRTLLIDGDLRLSGLTEILGSDGLPGVTEWWQGAEAIPPLRRVDGFQLWYLPAGEVAERPLEILQSQRMSKMLTEVAPWFDWVVIDTPPLVPLADPAIWAAQADGTLLVVKQGKTPTKLLQKALESTDNLNLLGVVMNHCQDTPHKYYRQYYKRPRPGSG